LRKAWRAFACNYDDTVSVL